MDDRSAEGDLPAATFAPRGLRVGTSGFDYRHWQRMFYFNNDGRGCALRDAETFRRLTSTAEPDAPAPPPQQPDGDEPVRPPSPPG